VFSCDKGTHTASYSGGTRVLSKRLISEVNYSYLSSTEVMNGWRYTSTPPMYLHALDRENFHIARTSWLLRLPGHDFKLSAD
jgi:hypothetical protein